MPAISDCRSLKAISKYKNTSLILNSVPKANILSSQTETFFTIKQFKWETQVKAWALGMNPTKNKPELQHHLALFSTPTSKTLICST